MWKRVFELVVGTVGLCAGLVAVIYSIQELGDFWNPAVPFRLALLGEFLLISMALFCLGISIRFLWSKKVSENERVCSWLKAMLLGMGCFFPGCILSLPLMMMLADHIWPGDGQSSLAGLEFSLYAGIVTAVATTLSLLAKRNRIRAASRS